MSTTKSEASMSDQQPDMIPATSADERDLLSTGRLCQLFGVLPSKIEAAAERAGVCPALSLNGVAYWCAGVAELIRDQLEQ